MCSGQWADRRQLGGREEMSWGPGRASPRGERWELILSQQGATQDVTVVLLLQNRETCQRGMAVKITITVGLQSRSSVYEMVCAYTYM